MLRAALVCLLASSACGQQNFSNKSAMAYDPSELLSKIFSINVTEPRRIIKFEDQFNSNYEAFDDENSKSPNSMPFKFEIDQETNIPIKYSNDDNRPMNGAVKFDNFDQNLPENGINNSLGNGFQHGNKGKDGKKKKRRRRRPRQQFPGQPAFWNPGYPGPIGIGSGPGQNLGPNRLQPEFNGQFHRPPRRPEPSLASDAFVAVTGALTSIAHNDDYQCVARLLCEAAAGGALGGSSLLDSVSGLQPLLTLLSAYNGISSNPLFVFGRAAFLGMSSKGNSGSCRYAYPLCPTDPEQLVHYLNNHNGGFFRFFNAPQQGQQNLEQFYNQLSQNYGLYQPSPGINQEFYGLLNPGLHQNSGAQPNLYTNGYGYQQNYGFAYPYNQNYNNGNGNKFKSRLNNEGSKINFNANGNEIEKRIQNKPASFLNDNSEGSNSKWLFPGEDDDDNDESQVGVQSVNVNDFGFTDNRKGKALRFPDSGSTYSNDEFQEYNKKQINFYNHDTKRKPTGIFFPESQSNVKDYNTNKDYSPAYPNEHNYLFNNINQGMYDNFKRVKNNNNNNDKDYKDEPGVTTVYIVRGNGDPSKPEIVKLRPGETISR